MKKIRGGVILCEIAVYNIINTMFKYIQSTSTHKCIGYYDDLNKFDHGFCMTKFNAGDNDGPDIYVGGIEVKRAGDSKQSCDSNNKPCCWIGASGKTGAVKTASTATKTAQRAQASKLLDDVDNGDDDEDDDEVINAVVGQQGDNSKDKIKFIIGGSAVVLVVVLAFVLLRGAFNSAQPSSPPPPNSPTEPSQDQQISEPENPGSLIC